MQTGLLRLDRTSVRHILSQRQLLPVVAAADGRFAVVVPDFADGQGPLYTANVKELQAQLSGSNGNVTFLRLEASPQVVPTNGTNVIIINRVDEFVQLGLNAKFFSLMQAGIISRAGFESFLSYVRGYNYVHDQQTVEMVANSGFHSDVYHIPVSEFIRKYVAWRAPTVALEPDHFAHQPCGYYVKKPLAAKAAFIDGSFEIVTGDHTIQQFLHGAVVVLPDDDNIPLSFIDRSDADISYVLPSGGSILGANLPALSVTEIA